MGWLRGLLGGKGGGVAAPPVPEVEPRRLAFVLLGRAELPPAEAIVAALAQVAPSGAPRLAAAAQEPAQGAGGLPAGAHAVTVLEVDGQGSLFVALMPVAVPKGEADAAAQFSISRFQDGWTLPPHAAHLVVFLQDAPGHTPLQTQHRFTLLLGAITEAARSAVGVYWGEAGATHAARFLVDIVRDGDADAHVMLWNGFGISEERHGRVSLLSHGMGQLGLPNLLLTAPREQLSDTLGTFFDLLGYVARRGQPIPAGDTVGSSAEERLAVRYEASPTGDGTRVWRVDLP